MKKTTYPPPPQVISTVADICPDGANGYRLIDQLNRLFPDSASPPFSIKPRVEFPVVPAGLYAIQFEDSQGGIIMYADRLAEIRLEGLGQVAETPEDIDVRRERSEQRIEKRVYKYERKKMENEGFGQLVQLLVESQRQTAETTRLWQQQTAEINKLFHQQNAENTKLVVSMATGFSEGQRQLLDQQSALFKQSHALLEQVGKVRETTQENWPGTVRHSVDSLAKLGAAAFAASAINRKGRREEGVLTATAKSAPSLAPASKNAATTEPKSENEPKAPPSGSLEAATPPELPITTAKPADPTLSSPAAPGPSSASASTELAPTQPKLDDARADVAKPVEQTPSGPAMPQEAAPQSAAHEETARAGSSAIAEKEAPKSASADGTEPSARIQDAEPEKEEEEEAEINPALAIWEEIKRRIVRTSDVSLASILTSRESFLAWLSHLTEPVDELGEAVPA